jgi:DNA-binding NarL/FixJ family response regulator
MSETGSALSSSPLRSRKAKTATQVVPPAIHPPAIKICLVGEHPIILEALKVYLDSKSRFAVVAMITELADLSRFIPPSPPDVTILDAATPQFDAVAVTKRLIGLFSGTKIIGLIASHDRGLILGLIRAGARGCLGKACSPSELFHAVESVHAGDRFFSPKISHMIEDEFIQRFSNDDRRVTRNLKDGEQQLLCLIANGLSNKEMAEELQMSVRTVEKYRESLMSKLGIRTVAGLTKFAVRNGLSTLE